MPVNVGIGNYRMFPWKDIRNSRQIIKTFFEKKTYIKKAGHHV